MAGTETLVSLWHSLSRQVVLTCRDGRYGRTSRGILCTHFVQIGFVHNLVEMCEYSSGHVVTAGQEYIICLHTFGTCLDAVLTTPCCDNHIMSFLCRATVSPAIQNGRNKVCRAVSRIVATRTSQMSCIAQSDSTQSQFPGFVSLTTQRRDTQAAIIHRRP